MELLFRSSTAFEAVSEAIFDPQHDLEAFDRLFLQTWFVRLGVDKPEQYEQLIADLLHYVDGEELSGFLQGLPNGHPSFVDWFGKSLVGKTSVRALLKELASAYPFGPVEEPDFVSEARQNLEHLDMPGRLQEIVGEPWPKPEGPIYFVISRYSSHPYNIYPDVVLNPVKDNHKWHIAGFGHEAGHLLTWEMCRDPEVRSLCQNETTKGFGERVAEFCNKLLLDAYRISCKEVFPECDSWADYMYEKNPGKPLFDAMLDEIQLGSYTSFRSECIRILQRFQ